jgi:hypothetical protein
MNASDLRNAFDNELRRGIIENHPGFPEWYESMSPRAQYIIDRVIEENVTPELIEYAGETMEVDKFMGHRFIQYIAGGNPNPDVVLALTNMALEDIAMHVLLFGKSKE